ncbi:hypothetical protein V8C86DRAFT_69405 [Haematococcus lacustris]
MLLQIIKLIVAFLFYLWWACWLLTKPVAASLVFVQWHRLLIDKADFCLSKRLNLPIAYLACSWLNSAMAVVFFVVVQNVVKNVLWYYDVESSKTSGQVSPVESGTPTHVHSTPTCAQLWRGPQAILRLLFCAVWLALCIAVVVLSHLTFKAAIAAGLDSRSFWLNYDIYSSYFTLAVAFFGFLVLLAYATKDRGTTAATAAATTAPLLTRTAIHRAIRHYSRTAFSLGYLGDDLGNESAPAVLEPTSLPPAPAPSPPTLPHPTPNTPPCPSPPPSRQDATSTIPAHIPSTTTPSAAIAEPQAIYSAAPATTATLRHGRSPGPSHRPSRPPSQQHPSSADPAATATPAPSQPSPRPTTQQHLSAAATATSPTADRATAATVSRQPSQASMGERHQAVGCNRPVSQRGMRWAGQSQCSFPPVPGATPPP